MHRHLLYAGVLGGAGQLLLAAPLLAHDNQLRAPHDLWNTWNWNPFLLLGLVGVSWFYSQGLRQLWQQAGYGHGVSPQQALAFNFGLLSLFVALISPLDVLSNRLFAAHIVQHLLLVAVAAPLMVWGTPLVALLWAIPRGQRRPLAWWWRRQSILQQGWQRLCQPLTAWGLQALALWLWHLPVFYEAALQDGVLHAVEHGCLLGAALLFWWVVLHGGSSAPRNWGLATLLLFTTALHTGGLGALITFAATPWYATYDNTAARGLTALADQQLAGVIMWVPMGTVYLFGALSLLYRGLQLNEAVSGAPAALELDLPAKPIPIEPSQQE